MGDLPSNPEVLKEVMNLMCQWMVDGDMFNTPGVPARALSILYGFEKGEGLVGPEEQ